MTRRLRDGRKKKVFLGGFWCDEMDLIDVDSVAIQGREVVPSRPKRNHASALQGALRLKRKGNGITSLFVFKITRGLAGLLLVDTSCKRC